MHDTPYTLITGASSGMGEASAKLLAKTRNLVLCGRDEKRLLEVAEICRSEKADARIFTFDLEKSSEVRAAFSEFCLRENLPIEAIAYFAGMTEVLPVSRTTYGIGLKVMNVNYFSAVELIACLLKKKINARNLRAILLVSSIVIYGGKRYQPHYCASKAAIASLGKALAAELAPDIRVNVIAPGSFKTRIVETLFHDPSAPWSPPSLLPPGDVEDVANLTCFLLSSKARYLTGQVIDIDGGEHFPKLG